MPNTPTSSPLGKKSAYISQYQADLLFPIPRATQRTTLAITTPLPFHGADIWNAYELSWLNTKGKPVVALGEFIFPCDSPNIIESKSFKLYLNSFNNTRFTSTEEVCKLMQSDLTKACGTNVIARIFPLNKPDLSIASSFAGTCIDDLDISCENYEVDASILATEPYDVTETLYSDLLKSNCLVTGQPDWGSLQIQYSGKQIRHENLLSYIISFRNHNEFHEHCVERIFMDIMHYCKPEKLCVYARYVRRGGLDINPYRTTETITIENTLRLCRQ